MSFRTIYGNDWSEKGWRMCNRDECDIVRIPGLYFTDTAPIRKGAPHTILGAWLFWYDRNVEEIVSPVWGWSATNDVPNSNHLAGIAVDINAPKYPWGKRVMPPNLIAKVREGMALFSHTGRWQDSVIFWGADWNRADEMHADLRFPEGDRRNEEFAQKLRDGYLGIYSSTSPPPPASKADQYALAVMNEGRRRGITPRGIQIAFSVVYVESDWKMYANIRIPESLKLPHDAVGSDHDSVGLFQQRYPMWGELSVLMDPAKSAGLFYDRLAKLDYNNPNRLPGDYAADVQRPATKYRGRYQERMGDAVALYNRLTAAQTPGDDDLSAEAERLIRDIHRELTQRHPSRSPLRHLDEGLVDTVAGFVLNADGSQHVEIVKLLASLGHPESLALLREVAGADPVKHPNRQGDAKIAQAILAEVAAPVASVSTVPAEAPDDLRRDYSRVIAENAELRTEILALRAQVSAAPPPAVSTEVVTFSGSTGEQGTGQVIGELYSALEKLRLADALPIEGRAPLAALISVLQTKNGT